MLVFSHQVLNLLCERAGYQSHQGKILYNPYPSLLQDYVMLKTTILSRGVKGMYNLHFPNSSKLLNSRVSGSLGIYRLFFDGREDSSMFKFTYVTSFPKGKSILFYVKYYHVRCISIYFLQQF